MPEGKSNFHLSGDDDKYGEHKQTQIIPKYILEQSEQQVCKFFWTMVSYTGSSENGRICVYKHEITFPWG